jgi:ABC-2 type transport system permease protein
MIATMRRYLDVLPLLVRLHVKADMEYRGAFLLDRLAQIAMYGGFYASLYILLLRFGTLAGWTWPEIALLFSVQLLSWSLGAAFTFVQFRTMEEEVRLGTFDTLLVKPFSPWAYMAFSGFNSGYAGHVILASALLVWSLTQISWSIGGGLFLVLALINGGLINGAIVTMIGATALIWVRSNYLYSIFFGFWEMIRFPLSIYPVAIQAILLTIVPLGYTTYVPVAYFLGKPIVLLGDWGGPLSLLVGPALVLLAMVHWRYAISRYQSGGG